MPPCLLQALLSDKTGTVVSFYCKGLPLNIKRVSFPLTETDENASPLKIIIVHSLIKM